MAKKHKRYRPQNRKRLKQTTGQREFVNVVYMEKETVDGVKNVYATCTCETWRSSPEAKTFTQIGQEAKEHVNSSGGKCRLRHHDPYEPETPDPLSEEAVK